MSPSKSTEYEILTKQLMDLIGSRTVGLVTTRLEQDVVIKGRSGPNQVDVVWEFSAAESNHRIVFECRLYKSALKRSAIHAFRSVVQDISVDGPSTTGVMVTFTGYQSGAIEVAQTHDVMILVLRPPTLADLTGRLTTISLVAEIRMPRIGASVDFQATRILSPAPAGLVDSARYSIRTVEDQVAVPLVDLFFAGVLPSLPEKPLSRTHRRLTFNPPAEVWLDGVPIALVTEASAEVWEEVSSPQVVKIGGRENLAHMLRNVFDSTVVWFDVDGGAIYTSDDRNSTGLRPVRAAEVVIGESKKTTRPDK